MAQSFDVAQKAAVVTGGASGIGKGIAAALKQAGARVMIADIEAEALARTQAELGVEAQLVDVSDAQSVEALAHAAVSAFGKVHILCNNAGVGPFAPVADLSLEDWRWLIDVNLWGVIHGVHSFLPLLREHGEGGHIVNTSSMAGLCIVPHLAAYSVTKFGVAALTETLRIESELYGYGVGTSLLCPGPVRTNIGKSSRNRPNSLADGALGDFELEDTNQFDGPVPWLSGEDVGEMVVQAIKTNAPYVITHPELADPVIARHAAIEAAMQSPRPDDLSR